MSFDEAFAKTIGHEGGYVNDPRDAGGETNWGISKRAYPDLDIKSLTIDQAKAIYKLDYWDKAGCELYPDKVAYQVFDCAVNHGLGNANRFLQRALGVADDGIIGNVTLSALKAANPDLVVVLMNVERLEFFTKLSSWPAFGKGWARRVAANIREGVA